MTNNNLIPKDYKQKNNVNSDVKQNLKEATHKYKNEVVQNGYYSVSGKAVESASLINAMALENNIKTKVNTWKNDCEAGCTATSWIGSEDNSIAVQSRTVIHNYSDKYEEKLLEFIKNNCRDYTDRYGKFHKATINVEKDIDFIEKNGIPYPRIINPSIHLNFLLEWNRFKSFADRDAESKAIARSQRALLGFEFRTEEEIAEEAKEVEMVQNNTQKYYQNNDRGYNNSYNSNNKEYNNKPNISNNNEIERKNLFMQLNTIIKEQLLDTENIQSLFIDMTGKSSLKDASNIELKNLISELQVKSKTESTNFNPNIEDKLVQQLISNGLATQVDIDLHLASGDFVEWSNELLAKPMNINASTNIESDPIIHIKEQEAKGIVSTSEYDHALKIFFRKNNIINNYSNILSMFKQEKGYSKITVNVYRDIFESILANEAGFISMVKNIQKEVA